MGKIDPSTDTVSFIGPELRGRRKWHGGVTCGDYVVGIPNHADSVLRINTRTGEVDTIGPTLSGEEFGYLEGRYKYLGGVQRGDAVYFMPGFALRVMKVVPAIGAVSLVGKSLGDTKNKWQNGYLGPDNAVYGIPVNNKSILRIG